MDKSKNVGEDERDLKTAALYLTAVKGVKSVKRVKEVQLKAKRVSFIDLVFIDLHLTAIQHYY